MAILTSLAIPNILKWVALSKLDAVKTLLNSAAAECLQEIRTGSDPQAIGPPESTISNDNLSSYGYQIKSSDTKCSSFFVSPTQEGEKLLYTLGFKITDSGSILKIAIPAEDSASLSSCKNWAGVNCGVSPEQQAIWDALAKVEKDKRTCNDEFYSWLQKSSTGSYNRWDEASKSCTMQSWAFEGIIQKDEQAVKDARTAKIGTVCAAKLKDKETAKFDGAFVDPDCGTTYFCSGKDMATDNKTAYDACKEEERQLRCTAALGAWKNSKVNGQFNESGCTTMWQCNGQYLTTQADFDASSCGCTWVDEQYQTGTELKKVQTGTTTSRGGCTNSVFGACVSWATVTTPIYEMKEMPTYGTRKVCRK